MKLLRFGEMGQEKPGVEVNGKRKDCSAHFSDWNRAFFQEGGLEKLSKIIENESLPDIPDDKRWGSCVSRPGAIICIGLSYSDHAAEAGMDVPKEPIIFTKLTNTIAGPYDDVAIPKNSEKTDWEVELAIVIGKDSVYLNNEEEAWNNIAGFCVMNDVSERAFQIERGGQWIKGKSCPGFSPVGPYMVTKDEINDVNNLAMKLSVNGEQKQDGNTSTMIFKSAFLVHYLSQFMKLEAGDIITTGTPPGVGMGFKPAQYLKKGDVVELSIEGLGTQKQKFV